MKEKVIQILNELFFWSLNFLGSLGIVLIAYGVYADFSDRLYDVIEDIADVVSLLATLATVILTAISVYFRPNNREASVLSKFVTVPVVVIAVLVAFAYYCVYMGDVLPQHILNGFAVLGLSGALFRLFIRK